MKTNRPLLLVDTKALVTVAGVTHWSYHTTAPFFKALRACVTAACLDIARARTSPGQDVDYMTSGGVVPMLEVTVVRGSCVPTLALRRTELAAMHAMADASYRWMESPIFGSDYLPVVVKVLRDPCCQHLRADLASKISQDLGFTFSPVGDTGKSDPKPWVQEVTDFAARGLKGSPVLETYRLGLWGYIAAPFPQGRGSDIVPPYVDFAI